MFGLIWVVLPHQEELKGGELWRCYGGVCAKVFLVECGNSESSRSVIVYQAWVLEILALQGQVSGELTCESKVIDDIGSHVDEDGRRWIPRCDNPACYGYMHKLASLTWQMLTRLNIEKSKFG